MNISINRVPSISNEIMHGGLSSALAHRFFKRVASASDPSSLLLSPRNSCTLITDGNETLEEHVYAILCRYYFKYRNKSTNCTVVMKNEQYYANHSQKFSSYANSINKSCYQYDHSIL